MPKKLRRKSWRWNYRERDLGVIYIYIYIFHRLLSLPAPFFSRLDSVMLLPLGILGKMSRAWNGRGEFRYVYIYLVKALLARLREFGWVKMCFRISNLRFPIRCVVVYSFSRLRGGPKWLDTDRRMCEIMAVWNCRAVSFDIFRGLLVPHSYVCNGRTYLPRWRHIGKDCSQLEISRSDIK